MGELYIRLNNKFVHRKGKRFYLTSITDPDEWSDMTNKQKLRCMGKDVTAKIKKLLKQHGSKYNMNFKTNPSKKKIRKTTKKKKQKKKGGE
jgi:hypothetical protein